MTPLKPSPRAAELDQLLAAAETDPVSQAFRTALGHVQPTAAFTQQLETQLQRLARAQPRAAQSSRRWLPTSWRGRQLALAALAMLLLLALGGWLLVRPPAPVSAQEVLRRAASVQLAPNQTAHYRYRMQPPTGASTTSTAEVWVQAAANGAIMRTAQTLIEFGADGTPDSIQRRIITGFTAQYYGYNPRRNTITIQSGSVDQVIGDQPNLFDGASVARYLSTLAQGDVQGVRLLPAQTLDGTAVIVVQAVPAPGNRFNEPFTAYFDAERYIIRGFDSPDGHIRMTLDQTVSADAVPPDAFLLNPPAAARVVSP